MRRLAWAIAGVLCVIVGSIPGTAAAATTRLLADGPVPVMVRTPMVEDDTAIIASASGLCPGQVAQFSLSGNGSVVGPNVTVQANGTARYTFSAARTTPGQYSVWVRQRPAGTAVCHNTGVTVVRVVADCSTTPNAVVVQQATFKHSGLSSGMSGGSVASSGALAGLSSLRSFSAFRANPDPVPPPDLAGIIDQIVDLLIPVVPDPVVPDPVVPDPLPETTTTVVETTTTTEPPTTTTEPPTTTTEPPTTTTEPPTTTTAPPPVVTQPPIPPAFPSGPVACDPGPANPPLPTTTTEPLPATTLPGTPQTTADPTPAPGAADPRDARDAGEVGVPAGSASSDVNVDQAGPVVTDANGDPVNSDEAGASNGPGGSSSAGGARSTGATTGTSGPITSVLSESEPDDDDVELAVTSYSQGPSVVKVSGFCSTSLVTFRLDGQTVGAILAAPDGTATLNMPTTSRPAEPGVYQMVASSVGNENPACDLTETSAYVVAAFNGVAPESNGGGSGGGSSASPKNKATVEGLVASGQLSASLLDASGTPVTDLNSDRLVRFTAATLLVGLVLVVALALRRRNSPYI